MALKQFIEIIPVSGRPLAVEQARRSDDFGSGANANNDRTFCRLILDPS